MATALIFGLEGRCRGFG